MANKKLLAICLDFDYQLTENKIEALKELIDAYNFIPTSLHLDEHSIETIKAESWDRIFNEMSKGGKGGIPTEQDLKRSYTGDYSDLCKESDYETKYLWLDKESKNKYLSNSLCNIESGLEDCFWYIAKNNIVDNRNLSIFETHSKKLLRIKNIIQHNIDTEYYNTYKSERDLIENMYDFDGDSDRSTEKEEVKERYLEIKNSIANFGNTEVDLKKQNPRRGQKYTVGMLVAQGKLNKYWNNTKTHFLQNYSRTTIANDFNIPEMSKVIYETITNQSTGKNVFNDFKIMSLIIEDCKEFEVKVDNHFLDKFEELKQKNI